MRSLIKYHGWSLLVKKEVQNNSVTFRYSDGKQEQGITIQDLLKKAQHECFD